MRFTPLPPKTMFPFGTSVVLLELPLRVRLPGDDSLSPTVNAMALVAVSSFVDRLVMSEMVGGVLTRNRNVSLLLFTPSLTVTVIVDCPV